MFLSNKQSPHLKVVPIQCNSIISSQGQTIPEFLHKKGQTRKWRHINFLIQSFVSTLINDASILKELIFQFPCSQKNYRVCQSRKLIFANPEKGHGQIFGRERKKAIYIIPILYQVAEFMGIFKKHCINELTYRDDSNKVARLLSGSMTLLW